MEHSTWKARPVHIAGRSDAAGCGLGQPDFDSALSRRQRNLPASNAYLRLDLSSHPDSILQANPSQCLCFQQPGTPRVMARRFDCVLQDLKAQRRAARLACRMESGVASTSPRRRPALDAEDYVVAGKCRSKSGCPRPQPRRQNVRRWVVQAVHSPSSVPSNFLRSGLAYRTVRANERGNRVERAIECGERNLRIWPTGFCGW